MPLYYRYGNFSCFSSSIRYKNELIIFMDLSLLNVDKYVSFDSNTKTFQAKFGQHHEKNGSLNCQSTYCHTRHVILRFSLENILFILNKIILLNIFCAEQVFYFHNASMQSNIYLICSQVFVKISLLSV